MFEDTTATGLGIASIGIGLAEIAAAVLPVVAADVVTCMKLTFSRD